MKLRNKKTGQLGNFIINKDHFECVDLDYVPEYRSIAKLAEEWEDYEEPKEYWYFDCNDNKIYETEDKELASDRNRKSIGNYFEAKEEAEKAVEKLKAWKRLEGGGFKFDCYIRRTDLAGYSEVVDLQNLIDITAYLPEDKIEEMEADLELLFGGE